MKNYKYYFNVIIKFEDLDFGNILVGEKSHKNILISDISYNTLIAAKPLHIRFNQVDGFIRVYDRNRYLVLFSLEKHDVIYNRIKFLIVVKSGITCFFSLLCENQS